MTSYPPHGGSFRRAGIDIQCVIKDANVMPGKHRVTFADGRIAEAAPGR